MRIGEVASVQQNQILTSQALAVASKIQDAAELEGQAAMRLIAASGAVSGEAAAPPRSADGTGRAVDVLA